jgi:hypothetical protein
MDPLMPEGSDEESESSSSSSASSASGEDAPDTDDVREVAAADAKIAAANGAVYVFRPVPTPAAESVVAAAERESPPPFDGRLESGPPTPVQDEVSEEQESSFS